MVNDSRPTFDQQLADSFLEELFFTFSQLSTMLGVVGQQWRVGLHGFFYNSGFFDNLITSNYCKQVTVRLKAILEIIVKWVAYEIPRNQETRIIIINRKHLQDWAVLQSQFVRWAIGFVAWEPCFVEPSIRDFKSHRNNLSGYRLIGESFTGHHHAVQLYLFLIYPLRVRM